MIFFFEHCVFYSSIDALRNASIVSGWIALVVTSLTLGGLIYYGIPVDQYIQKHYIQFIVSSLIVSYLVSIALYLRARRKPKAALSQYGSTGKVYNIYTEPTNVAYKN